MKKIILFSILLLVFLVSAGCSSGRMESTRAGETSRTRRSIVNNFAENGTVELPAERAINTRRRARQQQRRRVPAENTSGNNQASPEVRLDFPEHAHSYETEFDTKDAARSENIALAAKAINGTTVQPNETFSFNKTVGSTTKERGYKKGVIFTGGKKSKGYGGGVCQVSTTLCNAAHAAGMTITERHDHSLPVAYVKDGLQAATSNSGKLDFKFQNDKPYPVIIRAATENGKVSVSVGRA